MIAFAVCMESRARYLQYARPGIERCGGPEPVILERVSSASICSAYNELLAEASKLPNLEGLILVHDDTELRDAELVGKIRRLFQDETIAVVGAIGATGVTSLAWWLGERHGQVAYHGGVFAFGQTTTDVDAVDGLFMALSPWAVNEVRFDEKTFAAFHGYDIDYCFEVRRRGRRVVAAGVDVEHQTPGGFGDLLEFKRSDLRFRAKWGFTPRVGLRSRAALLPIAVEYGALRERIGPEVRFRAPGAKPFFRSAPSRGTRRWRQSDEDRH